MDMQTSQLRYSVKKFIRTRTIWHWILYSAFTLFIIRFINPKTPDEPLPEPPAPEPEPDDGIDWSRFSYCQYVTDEEYLCNSLMMFESLHRLGSKADRLLLYPSQWELYPKKKTWISMFLHQAQRDYKVHIVPVRVQHFEDGEGTWAESFTKLLAFKQTQYERVLSLDSDATILKPMDELFLLPSAPVAVPTAYWIGNDTVSSAIMLIEPSMDEYKKVLAGMKNRVSNEFDMDLVNDLYAGNAMVLPNDYWVVSGEFRKKTHNTYLKEGETWDAEEILNRTKYVHFSDWPFPKPWYPSEPEEKWAVQPPCKPLPDGTKDCKDRDAWLWVYADFKKRREEICTIPFTLYPE